MGSQNNARTQAGMSSHAALVSILLLVLWPSAGRSDCSGAGCPTIALSISGGEDCPGPACPAFAQSIEDQQNYLELFGTLQSGGDEARPLDGRLLLDIQFVGASTELPEAFNETLSKICILLRETGVRKVEILGLPVGGRDTLASRRAEIFANKLGEACDEVACNYNACTEVDFRDADSSDALPSGSDLSPSATIVEVRVVP